MSRSKGLLTYKGYEDNDDYHVPAKGRGKSRTQKYDEFTQHLKTGSQEYGYWDKDYGQFDKQGDAAASSNYDWFTGEQKQRAGYSKGSQSSRSETPNYGRIRTITDPSKWVQESERGDTPKSPLKRERGTPRLPNIRPNKAMEKDYSYRDIQDNQLSVKMWDSLKLSDIKQIDLVVTLNDRKQTKVVVKAAPFYPYNP